VKITQDSYDPLGIASGNKISYARVIDLGLLSQILEDQGFWVDRKRDLGSLNSGING
jgi:hypothetical protein